MKFNEIKKVNITVTQADIEKMIRDKVAEHDASIVVNSIEFERKLKPEPHIAVIIDADYGETKANEEPAEVQEELPLEEPTESSTETVGDIFGG